MNKPTKKESMASLEKTVEIYERVFDLSRDELMDAYKIIQAHEAVENLSRDELLEVKEELKLIKHRTNIKTNFFSNISHELRTPLTLLIAPLESMLQGELGGFNEEQQSYLQLMYENSNRLLNMVNELLDFSKMEAGKMKLYYKEDNITDLVKNTLETFIPFAEKTKIQLNINLAPKALTVYIDSEKIEKVIVNLVFNAFKYVDEKGTVNVSLKGHKNKVVFSVFNSGEGIPKDILDRVFDRYAQFEDFSKNRNRGGTGLGLALSKQFIELHKGEISMESKDQVGVTCEFSLPKGVDHIDKDLLALGWGELERRRTKTGELKRELPTKGVSTLFNEIKSFYSLKKTDLQKFEKSVKKSQHEDIYDGEARKSILIVEDNNEMRGFLRYVLSNYFDVSDAADGEEGYNKALALKPDLIISDVMMPRKNGYEMTKLLKTNDKTCRIPIILLTARANNLSAIIEGLNLGADDYISKPFNIKELIARSNALLRMSSLNNQLESIEGVIFSLANAVEAKDSYTEGHCFRLAELSSEIARRVGFNDNDITNIRNGAILHDVGKIGIPEMILTKPGRLTEEEKKVIDQHPLIGEKICRPLRSTSKILPIIRSHHERFDGKGYPDGLEGETIPKEARIVAIADAFDAMVYDRVYRKGMGINQARSIFRKERDLGQWDPALVDIFLEIDENWLRTNML